MAANIRESYKTYYYSTKTIPAVLNGEPARLRFVVSEIYDKKHDNQYMVSPNYLHATEQVQLISMQCEKMNTVSDPEKAKRVARSRLKVAKSLQARIQQILKKN